MEEKKNKDNDQNKSKSTAWIVAPVPAVRPRWQSANNEQNQYDEQDRSEHGNLPGLVRSAAGIVAVREKQRNKSCRVQGG